jgi:hypothetical protein
MMREVQSSRNESKIFVRPNDEHRQPDGNDGPEGVTPAGESSPVEPVQVDPTYELSPKNNKSKTDKNQHVCS